MRTISYLRLPLAFLTTILMQAALARAAPITITYPDTDLTFRESDEFAGMVAGKAWDMSDMHDVTWYSGFVPPLNHPTDGIWSGLYCRAAEPAYYWPLFRGVISDPGYYQYFTWHNPGTPYGPFNPIDADRFNRLAIRHALPAANRSVFTVNWFRTLLDATEFNRLAFADGDYARPAGGSAVWTPYPDGFRIYDIDLTGTDFNADRIPNFSGGGSPIISDAWGGTMYGFYIVPSLDARKDTAYALDWIRLYRSEPENRITLTWTNDPLLPDDHRVSLQLFVATNNVDDPGDLFLSGIENDGDMTFHTGALPPGQYSLYLKVMLDTGDGFDELGRSDYSPLISINARPTFEFTAPSFTSGVEYAAADRGKPWNMSGPEDLNLSRVFDIAGGGFTNNQLTATLADSDPQIALDVPVPIDTARYRYLTFRMFYDTSPFPLSDFDDCDQRAWEMGAVARWVWARNDFSLDGSYTKDILLQEGWYDYTVDLWDRELLETRGEFGTAQAGWQEIGQANFL
ncbi:MAG: hypothetical protein LC725_04155, partial [Lentisphaerae bacterium]|nr:hypothetical protein [Lentisphaerota bacterium]